MLNKTTSSKTAYLKIGVILPLLLVFFMSFQVKTVAQTTTAATAKHSAQNDQKIDKTQLNKAFKNLTADDIIIVNGTVIKMTALPDTFYKIKSLTINDNAVPVIKGKQLDFKKYNSHLEDWNGHYIKFKTDMFMVLRGVDGDISAIYVFKPELDNNKTQSASFTYSESSANSSKTVHNIISSNQAVDNQTTTISVTIDKNSPNKLLDTIKQLLKDKGVSFSYSGLKRNKAGEIIRLTLKLDNHNGHSTENSYTYSEGIPPLKISYSDTGKKFAITNEGIPFKILYSDTVK